MNTPRAVFRMTKRQNDEVPTPKGRRTKARILDAGRSVLEERGYLETSVSEITQRSGVALGTFYRYYENKDVLCLQLLETLVNELYESVSGSWATADTQESLRTSSLLYLKAYYANRKLIAAMLQMSGAVPECAALWWALRKRTYDRMRRYIESSKLAQTSNSNLTATALGSMVEQFAYYWYVEAERNGKPIPKLEDAADVLARIWHRAVYDVQSEKEKRRRSRT